VRVKLSHVSKSFSAIRAVIDVTLTLEPGTVTVIEGPNGSGKSTLLGIIGTLIRPSSGRIDYGTDFSAQVVRARLGWVGHDTLCYPDLTGRENIELSARLTGVDPKKAWEGSVVRFAIGDFAARPMRSASRGQKQRIALARAVVHEPELLLLDEPSTGLDAAGVERVKNVVEQESARGSTVVVVTHDGPFARQLNRKSFQMDKGHLVLQS
jgi:ABC-type multidrug transport system ATPase subunit